MRKKDDTLRDTLLELARAAAESQGPDAVNIRTIAKQAGVATGTVYNYFASKDDLLLALTEDCWRRALAELETAIPPGRFPARLAAVFTFLQKQLDAPGGRLMNHLGGAETAGMARMADAQRRLADILLRMLEEDREISPGVWDRVVTRESLVRLLMLNLTALLRTREPSPDLLAAVTERILYEKKLPPPAGGAAPME